jgi:energy-coupling factor transport system ATP-binding protein
VAAALARRPGLLISDESTAMVDREGRAVLVGLLGSLPVEREMAVVHVTHRLEEVVAADHIVRLQEGRIVDGPAAVEHLPDRPESDPPPNPRSNGAKHGRGAPLVGLVEASPGANGSSATATPEPGIRGDAAEQVGSDRAAEEGGPDTAPERLELVDVSHTYGIGTPWAQVALTNISLSIEPGEGVLVVGGNGSGKSTLAWILAGVLRPWKGECLIGGVPTRKRIGTVGLAFQHARLQLQRPTVMEDVQAAGAPDEEAARAALAAVGLDAVSNGDRRVDSLSGGQQRRVALSGILARRPSVLVLDEPLAGLDQGSRDGLLDVLASLRHDHGLTVIVISHDLEGLERVCDRVVTLEAGRISADRPAEMVAK